ncbi:MAG: hypothetical protein O3A01_08205, partial [bacterium]|nr:hypothetical protein [bacterium]
LQLGLAFFILMNPFAQFLYLKSVADDLEWRTFAIVYGKATIMSLVIYLLFAAFGEFLFRKVLDISFESFRIFGGTIIFSYSYIFIMRGAKGIIQTREDLDDLASEIALPFIVGAGTIYLSILIGTRADSFLQASLILSGVMLLNYVIVIMFAYIKDLFRKRRQVAFDKYLGIMTRLNGFFIGAIGVQMIVEGIAKFMAAL